MAAERKLDELAADYVVGNLSDEEADEFARLMVTNPELRSEVNRLEKTVGLMLNELPMMDPPSSLRDSVLAGISIPAEVPLVAKVPPAVVQSRRSPLPWVLAAMAAGTTVLSLVLGLNNYRLRLANQQLQNDLFAAGPAQQAQLILQQPGTRFYDFAGTDQATDAFGNMIVDTDELTAAIAFENLEPLAADQTYALWVNYQGQYVPCGDFQTSEDGTVFATLEMPDVYQSRPWVKDVIVTVESADLPAQPTGPIVAQTT